MVLVNEYDKRNIFMTTAITNQPLAFDLYHFSFILESLYDVDICERLNQNKSEYIILQKNIGE